MLASLGQPVEAARARAEPGRHLLRAGTLQRGAWRCWMRCEACWKPTAGSAMSSCWICSPATACCNCVDLATCCDKCRLAREQIHRTGRAFRGAQAILNEAAAYAGLGRFPEAPVSLDEARWMFRKNITRLGWRTPIWSGPRVLQRQGAWRRAWRGRSLRRSQSLRRDHELPVAEAQACLIAAEALRPDWAVTKRHGSRCHGALAIAREPRSASAPLSGYHLLGRRPGPRRPASTAQDPLRPRHQLSSNVLRRASDD